MDKRWIRCGFIALIATVFASNSHGQDATFNLPGMGGFAVSPDNSTLVVSLTGKTELVFIDTVAGKETKRVQVEFQPTQMAWGDKVLFAAQKSSGIVHVLDAKSGKEIATGNAGGPVRNIAIAKGVCFASTDSREITAIDAKGMASKTNVQGVFIVADPKGEFLYNCIEGKATTDVGKSAINGMNLARSDIFFRSLRASLINVQGMGITPDGKSFGVVAGGGWSEQSGRRHYSVPLYSVEDMKSQVGELETGAYPGGMATHPVLPLVFACNGGQGAVFNAKTFVAGQKIDAPKGIEGPNAPSVLAFVGKGQKLAWGRANPDSGMLKIYGLQLTDDQKAALAKAYK